MSIQNTILVFLMLSSAGEKNFRTPNIIKLTLRKRTTGRKILSLNGNDTIVSSGLPLVWRENVWEVPPSRA